MKPYTYLYCCVLALGILISACAKKLTTENTEEEAPESINFILPHDTSGMPLGGSFTKVADKDDIELMRIILSEYIVVLPPDDFFTNDNLLRRFQGATFPLYAGYTTFDDKGCITFVRKTSYPVESITRLIPRLEEDGCSFGGGWDVYVPIIGEYQYYNRVLSDIFDYEMDSSEMGDPIQMVFPQTQAAEDLRPDDAYAPEFIKSCAITSNLAKTRACLRTLYFDDHISLFIKPAQSVFQTPWFEEKRKIMNQRRAATEAVIANAMKNQGK